MSDPPRLDERDRDRFTDAAEASFSVSVRPRFFVWTQSSLQGLVPHEILICGIVDGSRQGITVHRFSASRYFGQTQFDAVCDPASGLMPRLLAAAEGSRSSVVMSPVAHPRAADDELYALVRDNEMKNMAAQLVVGTRGQVEAFYVFARLSIPLDERAAYLIELTVPHLHSAFMRVLVTERQVAAADTRRSGRLVTHRQEEILNLVKTGKTNAEIAEVLGCSPWTIKNHIQAILRKLDSNSRTHAIARAISLGILQSE